MLQKITIHLVVLLALLIGTLAVGLAHSTSVAGQDDAAAKIENAMSAAPADIAADATIMDNELDDAGTFVLLREGSNGWFCFPDVTTTPGNDPTCYDQAWLDWLYAFYAGEEPVVTAPGLAYMLQGGSDASNTDPLATAPAEGEEWVTSPPHIMVLIPGGTDLTAFPADHHSAGPYIMWAGTPYEHVMMPVVENVHEE